MALENLSVWTIPPDWSDGVSETLEWLTRVLISPVGAEQRFALRESPRRFFEMTFKPVGPTRTLFDLFIERASGTDIYLPVWHDSNRLTRPATAGSSSLTIGSAIGTEFSDSVGVFIQGAGPFDYETTEFSSLDVGANTIATADPLERTWSVGTKIFPLLKARVELQPKATRKADRAFQVTVRFSSDIPNPTIYSDVIAFTIYKDLMVLEREPNDVADLTFEYQRLLAELDNQTGKRTRFDLNPYGITVQQFAFFLHGRDDHSWVRSFFYALQGRRYPIYVPTFFADFELTEPLTRTAELTVKRCGYTDFAGPFRGRRDILVLIHRGDQVYRAYREILSSAIIGDGATEHLVLDEGFGSVIDQGFVGSVIPISVVTRISFMVVGRLDSDSIEIVHQTDSYGAATCTTNFRSTGEGAASRILPGSGGVLSVGFANAGRFQDASSGSSDDGAPYGMVTTSVAYDTILIPILIYTDDDVPTSPALIGFTTTSGLSFSPVIDEVFTDLTQAHLPRERFALWRATAIVPVTDDVITVSLTARASAVTYGVIVVSGIDTNKSEDVAAFNGDSTAPSVTISTHSENDIIIFAAGGKGITTNVTPPAGFSSTSFLPELTDHATCSGAFSYRIMSDRQTDLVLAPGVAGHAGGVCLAAAFKGGSFVV